MLGPHRSLSLHRPEDSFADLLVYLRTDDFNVRGLKCLSIPSLDLWSCGDRHRKCSYAVDQLRPFLYHRAALCLSSINSWSVRDLGWLDCLGRSIAHIHLTGNQRLDYRGEVESLQQGSI